MKQKLLLLLSFFIMFSLCAWSQTRTTEVVGFVFDAETNSPLVGATIIIDSTKYAITDAKGHFSVPGVPRKNVRIDFSYLGYESAKQNVLIGGTTYNAGTVRLKSDAKRIDDVVVTGKSVMATQRGDTVQYNASAFKTNPDADAKDLVAKMPGVKIENGTVEAQGESVKRVYVDGKLLFGDNATAALNNLPADAIESIQVFDELSDEAKFSGFDDGQRNRAMNVVTRHKVNRSTIARLNGGYGSTIDDDKKDFRNRFNVKGDYSTFTEEQRITMYANSSNVSAREGGSGSNSSDDNNGLFTKRAAGVGFYQQWKKAIELTLNYGYYDNQNVRKSNRVRDYFPTDQFESRLYNDTTYNKSNTISHTLNGRFEYKINPRNRVLFIPRATYNQDNYFGLRRASNVVDGEVNSVTNTDSHSSGSGFNTTGMLLYTHVFAKQGRSISANIHYGLSNNFSNGFQVDTTIFTTRPRDLKTITGRWNKNINARLSYGEPIAPLQRVEVSYSFRYEDSESDRKAYDYLINDQGELDIQLSNNYNRKYFSHSVGTAYSLNQDKNRLNAGVYYREIRLLKDQFYPKSDRQDRNFRVWEPRAEYRRNITQQKYFRFTYRVNMEVPTVEQFQNVINSGNLLQLSAGNPNLKPSTQHSMYFNYNSTNIHNSTSYYIGIGGMTEVNRISNRTTYFSEDTVLPEYNDYVAQKGAQLITPVNMDGYYSARLFTGYSFPVNAIKTNINLDASYTMSHVPSYTGRTLNYSNSNGASFRVGFVSNISENVDFTIQSRTRYSYASNSAKTDTKYLSERITGRVNIIFLGGFVFNSDFSYNYDHNASKTGFTQDFYMWNAGLGRKFLRKRQAEFRITVYDILRQNKDLIHSIGDNYIEDMWTNTIGRYAMLTFSYRFNSMNALSKSPSSQPSNNPDGSSERRYGPPSRGQSSGSSHGGYGGGYGGGGYHNH